MPYLDNEYFLILDMTVKGMVIQQNSTVRLIPWNEWLTLRSARRIKYGLVGQTKDI